MQYALLTLLVIAFAVKAQSAPPIPGFANTDAPVPVPSDAADSFWIRGEYLAWITTTRRGLESAQEQTSNALVNGLLTSTGTTNQELFQASFEGKQGYRLTAGTWLDSDNRIGVEASAYWLNRSALATQVTPAALAAQGLPGLTGAGAGGTFVIPISAAGVVNAGVQLELGEQDIYAAEVLGRFGFYRSESCRVDGLIGARCLTLEESQAVSVQGNVTGVPLLAGTSFQARGGVDTRATYVGAVIGLDGEVWCGPWFAGVRPRATVACVENEVTRSASIGASLPGIGSTAFNTLGVSLPTQQSQSWTVTPELDLRAGRQFGDHLRVMVGASLLVLPSAARASGQFDAGLPFGGGVTSGTGLPASVLILPPQLETLYLFTMSAGIEVRF